MNFPTIKQCFGGALMLTALVAAPAILKASSASAFHHQLPEELNLTSSQQAELDAIKDNARTQLESVLTDDQLASLEGKTGRERHQAMRGLDLSEAQRTQLREIRETSHTAAQSVFTDEQQAQLQALRSERSDGRKNRREEMAAELNLTSAQQTELDAIKASAETRVEAVLTADQLADLEGKTGRERMRAMRDLDLSEDQREQLHEIREETRAAADDVFTDEQKDQLEEMRSERQGRGGEGRRGRRR